MLDKDIKVFEKIFKEFLLHYCTNDFGLIVDTKDNWSEPLPEEYVNKSLMRIDISNWSEEVTKVLDSGIDITTAFGEVESSKFFRFEEILGLTDSKGKVLLAKPYSTVEQKSYTLKGLITQ